MASKGFGGSKAEPSKNAMQFMLAFKKYMLANPDLNDVRELFTSHLSELNESLLSSLPLIFHEFTKNKKPQEQYQIAAIFGNFSNSIREFPLGDRSINLEMSITSSQLALKIFTRRDNPKEWAMTQNNLGIAYGARIQGEKADNIEHAIACHELALQIYTDKQLLPEDWALVQNNLGIAYSNSLLGDRADNLEQAISAFMSALQVYTHEAFPYEWSRTQNNLGSAYSNRIRGDRANNLEQAISAFMSALEVYTREAFPYEWSRTQNNLGSAYSNRIRGDRANNLEQAISAFMSALKVYTREAFPYEWSRTQNNLGSAYSNRIRGDRADNLEQAISAFMLALQVYTREAFPYEWSRTQNNLGSAYGSLIRGNRANNLEQAMGAFELALQVYTREAFPEQWVQTQINFGHVLAYYYELTQNTNDLDRAIQIYKATLEVISPEYYNRKDIWQALLPTTQVILGSLLVKDGKWQEGLQLLLNSLTQLSTGDNPLAHANALYQTGRAYEVMSDLGKARLYYRDALRLYDHLNDDLGTTQSRAGLGSVLVSQGHLEKGINELAQAREGYLLLQKVEQAHDLDNIYQAAQRALERQATEVYS